MLLPMFLTVTPTHDGKFTEAIGSHDDDLLDDLPPMDGDESDEKELETLDDGLFNHLENTKSEEDDGHEFAQLPVGKLIEIGFNELESTSDEEGEAEGEQEPEEEQEGQWEGEQDGEEGEGIVGDDASVGLDTLMDLGADDERDGMDESLESEVDESSFPALGAEESEEVDERLDIGGVDLPEEVEAFAWSDTLWVRVETPLIANPMRFVMCTAKMVVAVGDGAVGVSGESDSLSLSEILLSRGRGVQFIGVGIGDRQSKCFLLASHHRVYSVDADVDTQVMVDLHGDRLDDGLRHVELGKDSGFAYATTMQGRLLVSADGGCHWRSMSGVGEAVGLVLDELGCAHVLAKQGGEIRWLRSDEGGNWESRRVEGVELGHGIAVHMAVHGSTWILGLETGELFLSNDKGDSWTRARVLLGLRCVAVVPTRAGTVVVGVLYVESEDRNLLFSWPLNESPQFVADLSPDVRSERSDIDPVEGLGQVHHCAWDHDRECLWVAGDFGLCAWRPALPT